MNPTQHQAVIVVVGNFNPAIFSPAWLASEQLISCELADTATIKLIHPSVAAMDVGWLALQVLDKQLVAQTSDAAYFLPLRDFVVGVLSILEHTPVQMLGINANLHFTTSSEEDWHNIGHRLAPKELWNGLLEQTGTRSLTIEGRRAKSPARYLRVKVEPSQQVQHGIFFNFNEHYQQEGNNNDAGFAREMLRLQWEGAQQCFQAIAVEVLHRTRGA
jgi:hypothetical protein